MALTLVNSGSTHSTINAAAHADFVQSAFTVLQWFYPTSIGSNNQIFSIATTDAFHQQQRFSTNNSTKLDWRVPRDTTHARVQTDDDFALDEWWFLASLYDESGSDAATTINIYKGGLTALATAVTPISHDQGSGSTESTSGNDFLAWGKGNNNQSVDGRGAMIAYVARAMSLAEIQAWQFFPRAIPDMKLWWIHYNLGTQADYSGHAHPSTTLSDITAVADHVPLGAQFGLDYSSVLQVAAGGQQVWPSPTKQMAHLLLR